MGPEAAPESRGDASAFHHRSTPRAAITTPLPNTRPIANPQCQIGERALQGRSGLAVDRD